MKRIIYVIGLDKEKYLNTELKESGFKNLISNCRIKF